MSSAAAHPPHAGVGGAPFREAREAVGEVTRYWWVWLVTGILWVVAGLVVLQFNNASVTTIGVLFGILLLAAAAQQLVLAFLAPRLNWLWALFSVFFLGAGIVALVNPETTTAGLADMLGFLFLLLGVWWLVEAFEQRAVNDLWWLTLVSAIILLILSFWASGQFFGTKLYTLLIFVGFWALMHGVVDIVRAFAVKDVREDAGA